VYYIYDLQGKSFWPMAFVGDDLHLAMTFPKVMSSTASSILPVDSGGDVRQFQIGGDEEIDSYVLLGPFMLGDMQSEGILHSITSSLAEGSENVNWHVFGADTTEHAYDRAYHYATITSPVGAPDFTGTVWTYTSGKFLNYMQHPRVRGQACYLLIRDVGDEKWVIEDIIARILPAGLRRI
jgi:hypothetical protein